MERLVKIVHIGATKEGVSKSTGKEWSMTDVGIEWKVEKPGAETYSQSLAGSVSGYVNREALLKCQSDGREVLVTYYTKIRMWEGKVFNDVKIYLPKEFMLEAKPL